MSWVFDVVEHHPVAQLGLEPTLSTALLAAFRSMDDDQWAALHGHVAAHRPDSIHLSGGLGDRLSDVLAQVDRDEETSLAARIMGLRGTIAWEIASEGHAYERHREWWRDELDLVRNRRRQQQPLPVADLAFLSEVGRSAGSKKQYRAALPDPLSSLRIGLPPAGGTVHSQTAVSLLLSAPDVAAATSAQLQAADVALNPHFLHFAWLEDADEPLDEASELTPHRQIRKLWKRRLRRFPSRYGDAFDQDHLEILYIEFVRAVEHAYALEPIEVPVSDLERLTTWFAVAAGVNAYQLEGNGEVQPATVWAHRSLELGGSGLAYHALGQIARQNGDHLTAIELAETGLGGELPDAEVAEIRLINLAALAASEYMAQGHLDYVDVAIAWWERLRDAGRVEAEQVLQEFRSFVQGGALTVSQEVTLIEAAALSDPGEGEPSWDEAQRLASEGSVIAHLLLAERARDEKRLPEALDWVERAMALPLDGKHLEPGALAEAIHGGILLAMGRFEDAEQAYETAIDMGAEVEEDLERARNGRRVAAAALEGDAGLCWDLGLALLQSGGTEAGLEWLERAARAGLTHALGSYTWHLLLDGEHERAVALFDEVIETCEEWVGHQVDTTQAFGQLINARSNDACHRLALGGPAEWAQAVWEVGRTAGLLESTVFLAVLATREGRPEDANTLVQGLTLEQLDEALSHVNEVIAVANGWFRDWCETAHELLEGHAPDRA